jgi:catechol 2,3-dioxygenase-like lactoylglutathione lyase family enzyme
MIDHMGLTVSDYQKSRTFYDAIMPAIGAACCMELTAAQTGGTYEGAGYGVSGKPSFWIGTGGPLQGRLHVAFLAPDRASVDAFYHAAIKAGAKDNGAPGIRAHYHPDYYGAFVLDPDGHNIEAVCHHPA